VNTQFITTDLKLATVLAFVGYKLTRTVVDPQGKQYLFSDPGDIKDLVADYENNIQGVSDAKGLLEIFEEQSLLGKSNAPSAQKSPVVTRSLGEGIELLPTTIETQEGREWTTRDPNTATLLAYRGNELLHTYVQDGRTKFTFSYDDGLTETVSLFNQKKLRCDPQTWILAAYKIRGAMRTAKGY
jgi:hypothetical protein